MEKELTRAARRAIDELGLPCELDSVLSLPERAGWLIQFTPGYGQLVDSFRNANGQRYSDREIAELIKQHLLLKEEMRVRPSER